VELNGDGHLDILSGSYSRMDADMAGLFQVLHGLEGGGFRPAEVLRGTDGEPLIIPAPDDRVTDRICTRPTAVDLDDDGDLDLVVGNFSGTFHLFEGTGPGAFSPECTRLTGTDGEPLKVPHHSDPFLVDWDGDGDLDLLSGSASGGVFLARNDGTPAAARFAPFAALVPTAEPAIETVTVDGEEVTREVVRLGDGHLTGPRTSTRVWAADVSGDGRLDLLVGDQLTLYHAAEGVDAETARAAQAKFLAQRAEHYESFPGDGGEDGMTAWQEGLARITADRDAIVRVEWTGYVWLFVQR